MKSTLAFAALALLATPAAAEQKSIEFCTGMGEIAQLVMETRQIGAPLHVVANDLGGRLDGAELDLALALTEAAYNEPLYSSDEYKQRAAFEFASDVFRLCRED